MQWRALRSLVSRTRVCVGIDLGTSHIKLVLLSRQGGKRTLMDATAVAIPPEVRANPAQRLAFYERTLREYLGRSEVPFLSEIALSLSGPEVTTATVLVSGEEKGKIREMAEAELGKILSTPLKDAVWTYAVGPHSPEEEGQRLPVVVAAAPARTVEELNALCRSFQLVPVVMTASPVATHHMVREAGMLEEQGPADKEAGPAGLQPVVRPPSAEAAVLEIGFASSALLLSKKGTLEFVRTLPLGCDHLIKGLMRTVATPEGQHAITASEAEEILKVYGIGMEEPAAPIAGLEAAKVYSMLRSSLEYLFLEVQRTLHYYSQTLHRPLPTRLLVAGGGACVPSLVEFLNANMDATTVEGFDPLALLEKWGSSSEEVQGRVGATAPLMAAALGIAVSEQGGRPVLLPFRRANYRLAWVQLAGRWVASIGLVVTLALSWTLLMQANRYRKLVRETQTRLGQLEPQVRQIRDYQRLKVEIEKQEDLISQALKRRPLWTGILKELSRITPQGIRLTSIETMEGAFPLKIRISGEIIPTYTSVEVLYSQYQLILEKSPFLSEIQLAMKKDMYSPVPRATFELTCRLVY
ncbi:MAG: pilus assembly protein PilM [Candidatus Omnitrophica bacterium]|nr:pilus assembly protein PilM [Candidatus Omnitrophota bacterium]